MQKSLTINNLLCSIALNVEHFENLLGGCLMMFTYMMDVEMYAAKEAIKARQVIRTFLALSKKGRLVEDDQIVRQANREGIGGISRTFVRTVMSVLVMFGFATKRNNAYVLKKTASLNKKVTLTSLLKSFEA